MKDKILKLKEEHPEWGKRKIAKALDCSTTTVRYHLDNNFAKRKHARQSQIDSTRLKEFKIKAVNLKGGKCEKCGYNRCLAALDFHHLNPALKDDNFGHFKRWEQWESELVKCILVCSNCHREIHHPA